MLRIKGEKKVQEYLLAETQKVYHLEGVTINDKHVETIIKQMLSKVRIIDGGDTYLMESEEVDRVKVQKINEEMLANDKKPASFKPLVLGITRIALSSDSFISAASFQETTRVLTNAAVTGREDHLLGLKENVILGRLIPGGTGFAQTNTREEPQEVATETIATTS